MQPEQLKNSSWFTSLSATEQTLMAVAHHLLEQARSSNLDDYSYIVFSAAKAYEGYLKRYLFETDLLEANLYRSRRFRIGRALNPDVSPRGQDEQWLYDDLVHHCGKDVASQAWQAWLSCRNHVFHYFPDQPNVLTLEQAENCLSIIAETIEALQQCKTR